MKTTYLRISSALAVFFFSVGFVRVASAFDLVCPGQQTSSSLVDRPTSSCTSSCPGPDDDDSDFVQS